LNSFQERLTLDRSFSHFLGQDGIFLQGILAPSIRKCQETDHTNWSLLLSESLAFIKGYRSINK